MVVTLILIVASITTPIYRSVVVRARETVRQGRRPERTVYELTDAGAREVTDWLTELLAVPAKEYPQFMVGLSFLPALEPSDVISALRDRARALEITLLRQRALRGAAAAAGLPRLFALEAEYEERLAETELDFVQELVKEIESGSLGGLEFWQQIVAGDDSGIHELEGRFTLREEASPAEPD